MDLTELARRLGATTLFSRLPREQLVTLLAQTPRRQVAAGSYLSESDKGLKNHLVLLSGELEARRTWTESDGRENTFAWRIDVSPDGPGFRCSAPPAATHACRRWPIRTTCRSMGMSWTNCWTGASGRQHRIGAAPEGFPQGAPGERAAGV